MANIKLKATGKVVHVPDDVWEKGKLSTQAWLVNNGDATWGDFLGDKAVSPEVGGAFDAAMISAGKTVKDLRSNANQLIAELMGNANKAEELKREQGFRARQFSPVEEQYPKSSIAGGVLPYFAVPGSKALQIGAGATEGFLSGDSLGERLTNAAVGAGGAYLGNKAGDAIGSRLGRRLSELDPASRSLSRAEGRLADKGINVSPAQRASITPGFRRSGTAQLASTVRGIITGSRNPPGYKGQVKVLNRMALKAIGEKGDDVSIDVLGSAHQRIGDVFESVGNQVEKIDINPGLRQRLAAIAEDATTSETSGAAIRRYFKELDDAANSASGISGERYVQLRSKIGKAARKAWRDGDELAGETADELLEILDDALEAASPQVASDIAKARQQWRMLTVLRKARTYSDGDINPASIERAYQSIYPGADVGKFPSNAAGEFGQALNDFRALTIPRATSNTAENVLRVAAPVGAAASTIAAGPVPAAIAAGLTGALAFGGGGTGGLLGGGTGRGLLLQLLQQQESR